MSIKSVLFVLVIALAIGLYYHLNQAPPPPPPLEMKLLTLPPDTAQKLKEASEREREEKEMRKRIPEDPTPDDLAVLQYLTSINWFPEVPSCGREPPVACNYLGQVIELYVHFSSDMRVCDA